MNIVKWLKENAQDLKGKRVVVTGSTGGLGGNIAKILAYLNANLVLADRNFEKSSQLKKELIEINKDIEVLQVKLDLLDPKSVVLASEELNKLDKIDCIIHNAGVCSAKFTPSEEYNVIFKTNFLHPYYFMKKMLPKMEQTPQSKIVVVGSIAHRFASLNEDDLDYSHCSSSQKIYGNSKRWLMFSFTELMKRHKSVKFVIAHPGITYTNITRHFPKFVQAIIKLPMRLVFNSPKHASLPIIEGVFEDAKSYEWIGPRVCDIWGKPKKKALKKIDDNECKRIYELAEEMCNELDKKLKLKDEIK